MFSNTDAMERAPPSAAPSLRLNKTYRNGYFFGEATLSLFGASVKQKGLKRQTESKGFSRPAGRLSFVSRGEREGMRLPLLCSRAQDGSRPHR
ncbi:MAG: hypothetical protein IJR99_07210 [Kiritimatiellae bacterium]|nr:hypothetical protein [Kiritimatiellia bacterium]